MTDNAPALGGQARQVTGREPGLPRLHQRRWHEMEVSTS